MELHDFIQIGLGAFFSIVVLFIATKLMGNRQMSQLSMFDYVNGITIGSIAAEMATAQEDLLKPLFAIVVCNYRANFVCNKQKPSRPACPVGRKPSVVQPREVLSRQPQKGAY